MSADSYRQQISRHQRELARLTQEKAREASKAADENKRANEAYSAARKANSVSSADSKRRDAERHEKAAVDQQKKVAALETRISKEHDRLNDTQRRLDDANKQEERRREQEQRRSREQNTRAMASMDAKLREHDRLHKHTLTTLEKLQQPPERVTVLFLAANPIDQKQLRLDEEVRAIGERIRMSDHRDAVRLESRWAVRPMDLLQAINECRPRVIHFSGHGSNQDEIVLLDDAGNSKPVTKAALVQTMSVCADDIHLVFFNTCYSRSQAVAVVEHVPAAIGMNTTIGDEAARIFAGAFYSAIGFGRTIENAFQQAKAALMLENIPEENTPELFISPALVGEDLYLVRAPR